MYKHAIGQYRGTRMTYKDSLRLFCEKSSLQMQEEIVKYCFIMCKMTVCNEEKEYHNYFDLRFVEFLEMIGRIAVEYARGSEIANETLEQKMKVVLDSLFALVSKERREVVIPDPDISDSDPDY